MHTDTQNNQARIFGMSLVCGMYGVPTSELVKASAREDVYNSSEGVVYKKALVKVAQDIFESTGGGDTVIGNIFTKLASADTWYTSYNKFTDAVRYAISTAARQDEASMSKQASLLLPIAAANGKLGETSQLLLGAGAATGILGGSIAHILNRNSRQASVDNAGIEAKILLYNRLRRDIEEDLVTSGALDTEDRSDEEDIIKKYEL